MGNETSSAPAAPSRVLEFRLQYPKYEATGRDGQPIRLLAKVGLLDRPKNDALEVAWEQPLHLPLPSESASAVIRLYAVDAAAGEQRLLTEVCVPPFACNGSGGGLAQLGVRAGGPPVPITVALIVNARADPHASPEEIARQFQSVRQQFHPERASMTFTIGEVVTQGAGGDRDAYVQQIIAAVPQSRRQVISLEIENLALKLRRSGGTPIEDASTHSHVRHLEWIERENEILKEELDELRRRLHQYQEVLAYTPSKYGPASSDSSELRAVLQMEFAHRQARRKAIEDHFQNVTSNLEAQLSQARDASASPQLETHRRDDVLEDLDAEVSATHERLQEAMAHRDELMRQWNKQRENNNRTGDVPEAGILIRATASLRARHDTLQEEYRLRLEGENGSIKQDDPRIQNKQLEDELEELRRAMQDERVRSESEIKELRLERDTARDRYQDAQSDLQRVEAHVDAMRTYQAEAAGSQGGVDGQTLAELKAEINFLVEALEELQKNEDTQKTQIRSLERAQEELVAKTTMVTSQALPVDNGFGQNPEEYERTLDAKVRELRGELAELSGRAQEQRKHAAELRAQAQASRAQAEAFKAQSEATQRILDERVLQNPGYDPAMDGRRSLSGSPTAASVAASPTAASVGGSPAAASVGGSSTWY